MPKAMKVIKLHMKKPAASGLEGLNKDKKEGMSLEEKMEMFRKKGTDIGSFLDSLTKHQREALWQRFSSARQSLKDGQADAMWAEVAKGKGSDPAKKKLLACFLKMGGELKGKRDLWHKELLTYTKSSGPFPAKKSRDPLDKEEWQFALRKSVAWTEEEVKHGFQAEGNSKAEAAQWMEMKAKGLLEHGAGEQSLGDRALQDLMPSNKGGKTPLALKDKSESDKEDEENTPTGSAKGKDGQVAEAEALSEVGKALPKKEALLRVGRMVKLLKKVKKEVGATKGKPLDGPLEELQKLEKLGSKINMEDAKGKLFDAAIQIKTVKKT
eukprot:s2929_g9.t1